jgi:hypothetical protein
MKRMLVVFAVLGLAVSLSAQSLADLARREKARREALAKHAVVIKSEDLRLVKKVLAVEVTRPEGKAAEPQPEVGLIAPPPGSEEAAAAAAEAGGSIEEQLKVIDARVDDLTTEMSSLRQQFEAQNTMVPGYVIQQRMDETNQRLTQALQQQAEVRGRLGGRAPAIRKDSGGPDR